jgi:hypothetical protein
LSNAKISPFLHPRIRKMLELGIDLFILIESISASKMSTEVISEGFALLYEYRLKCLSFPPVTRTPGT